MIVQTYYPTGKPFLAYCPRCKDRVRFESGTPNDVVCTCTKARWGYSHNCLRFETIRARVTDHKCDAKCVNAKGFLCECSCGGKNHGAGFSSVIRSEG